MKPASKEELHGLFAYLEGALEALKELVVVEGVEAEKRDERVACIHVTHRVGASCFGEARLEQVEDMEVAHRADLIQLAPLAVIEARNGGQSGKRLGQERTGEIERRAHCVHALLPLHVMGH